MRILQIEWQGTIGGLERYVSNLCLSLKNIGHSIELCVLHKEGALTDELKTKQIGINLIGMRSGFDLLGIWKFRNFLKRNKFDIVHVHERTIIISILLWIYCKYPKVFTEHGGELIGDKPWKRKYFYKFLSFQYAKIIANSNYVKCRISTYIGTNKLITVYNGIDLEKFSTCLDKEHARSKLNLITNKRVVGIVSRLIPRKGIDLFIETAKEIASVNKDSVFVIVGDGSHRSQYEDVALTLKGEVDIIFLGSRPDIENVLPIFDVFLFTSRSEPFGLVLLEAMAAGIPIVGFDIPGANEVVEKGKTAILVEPFNVKKLATGVLRLLKDEKLYSAVSAAGKERVGKYFSMRHNTKEVLKIYQEIQNGQSEIP